MYHNQGKTSHRPPIPVSNPTDAHYEKYGWQKVIDQRPETDQSTHKIQRGDIIVEDGKPVQKYIVTELTEEEIEARIPFEEKLRKEFDDKLNTRVEEIASIIETGKRGKELADEIRKK